MARASVLAAGGIVLRREQPPRIALVRLRKRDEWVLPKGRLDAGETPRTAARREVLEETGHDVTVHEFLGTLVHDAGGRSKVVHYWRMEAGLSQVRGLMHDIRAVEWLPLDAAVARLSRGYERVFLENVGPIAVNMMARQWKEKREAPRSRRHRAAASAGRAGAPRARGGPGDRVVAARYGGSVASRRRRDAAAASARQLRRARAQLARRRGVIGLRSRFGRQLGMPSFRATKFVRVPASRQEALQSASRRRPERTPRQHRHASFAERVHHVRGYATRLRASVDPGTII